MGVDQYARHPITIFVCIVPALVLAKIYRNLRHLASSKQRIKSLRAHPRNTLEPRCACFPWQEQWHMCHDEHQRRECPWCRVVYSRPLSSTVQYSVTSDSRFSPPRGRASSLSDWFSPLESTWQRFCFTPKLRCPSPWAARESQTIINYYSQEKWVSKGTVLYWLETKIVRGSVSVDLCCCLLAGLRASMKVWLTRFLRCDWN